MKKFLVALVVMGAAYVSQAAYLYWQVSQEAVETFAAEDSGVYGIQVKYGSEVQDIKATDGSSVGTVVDVTTAQNPGYLINLSGLSNGQSFYIEVIQWQNSSWNTVGVSSELAYTDVNQYTVELNSIAPILPAAWTGGSYAAPEPTSAMMILLGLAGLALKRKQI